ncbi:MAG TPA: cyclase family protein [Candidatus Kryptonia bacterium]|nr:cyclase family protein [Candidatus Kryptonia bacterium]
MTRRRLERTCAAYVAFILTATARFAGAQIDESKIVDLTYAFGPDTIYWPTAESFTLTQVSHGKTPAGYFYAANNLCMAEHGGTHMDAPIHFGEGKATVDQVPVTAGIGPAVVVDVRAQAAADRDYRVQVADLTAWEARHGRIPRGAIVIMLSGWGSRWGDKLRYLGSDKPGDVANLHFPGFSKEAAEFLVQQREIDAIGVDTASIDYGPSQDFMVHRIINGANKPAFENLAQVERLPPAGATIIALPMKIAGGSGGPTRVIALLP